MKKEKSEADKPPMPLEELARRMLSMPPAPNKKAPQKPAEKNH